MDDAELKTWWLLLNWICQLLIDKHESLTWMLCLKSFTISIQQFNISEMFKNNTSSLFFFSLTQDKI